MRRFIPYRPNLGDKRIRRCFAWLPIWVPAYPGGYNKDICPRGENVIWLEWVTVEEQWCWLGITSPRIGWKIIREVAANEAIARATWSANPPTKPEQVSSKLARYKKDAEVVTDEQEVFRRLVEAIVMTDMTADTLLEIRRLFGDEIDAAVACLRRTEK